ncbi:MAG: hypothetical protein UZ22_OP11002000714 [Microgenomates bacterium OLB23]|nr:MAG: hypothetical protein UZ22_OP11002000714 [Microgenomates bacterium OLB23]
MDNRQNNDICDVNGCDLRVCEVVDTGVHWRPVGLCSDHVRSFKFGSSLTEETVGKFLRSGEF